jgi:hypothetical protein
VSLSQRIVPFGKNTGGRSGGLFAPFIAKWVRLSRGKALAATGKVFEGRDEILSVLHSQK